MTDTPTQSEPIDAKTDESTDTLEKTTTDAANEWTTDHSDQETEPSPTAESTANTGFDPDASTVQRYLAWGALGITSLLAVFALIQFYGSVTQAIDLWVDPKFQPVIRAAFNLAVLLTSLIGVSRLVRELQ